MVVAPHGLVFLRVRAVASGESNPSSDEAVPRGGGAKPLLLESVASKSLQKLVANICGQLRLRGREVGNRPAYVRLYRGCQKGVNIAGMRPAENLCHARDLSAIID